MASSSEPKRPTLRNIARSIGLSLAATSMALRNHPSIPEKTRIKVQSAAKKMGYVPDPKISSLMHHLRTIKGERYHETLAFISPFESYHWTGASQHDFLIGSYERALELGYHIEVFHLTAPEMTPQRMSDLLIARGIRGLLMIGSNEADFSLELDWKHFAAVAFAYSLVSPAIHRVSTDYYREMISVLKRLKKEGYKKIGLYLSTNDDRKVFSLWKAAYLLETDSLPQSEKIPILEEKSFDPWISHDRPEVILSAGCDFPQDYEKTTGKVAPKNISYVNMNILHADERSRGVDQDSYGVGRLAAEHVIGLLQRNEIGIPKQPQVIAIEGKWVEDYLAYQKERENQLKVWKKNFSPVIAV